MNSRFVGGKFLRRGYTTGSCAAAAAKAATIMLLTQTLCHEIKITTPSGIILTLDVLDSELSPLHARCAIQKDSGDDPDATNGCRVYAYVTYASEEIEISGRENIGDDTNPTIDQPIGANVEIGGRENIGDDTNPTIDQPIGAHAINSNGEEIACATKPEVDQIKRPAKPGFDQPVGAHVIISGGEGIGRVTKPGLDQPVGAHAINSVPRRMIREECSAVCAEYGYKGGLSVEISIPDGEELARRTFNPYLGIVGGLSILGTSGIVEPMSEAAVVDTFKAELSMLYEAGHRDVTLTIGNYGERFARKVLQLPLESHVKCSNFIGETLSAAAEKGFSRVLLIGHIGKLVKLGIGITNTHSSYGDGRIETLISCALEAGAPLELLHQIRDCVSTDAALECLRKAELLDKTMLLLRGKIKDTLARHVAGSLDVNLICFNGMGDGMEELFSI